MRKFYGRNNNNRRRGPHPTHQWIIPFIQTFNPKDLTYTKYSETTTNPITGTTKKVTVEIPNFPLGGSTELLLHVILKYNRAAKIFNWTDPQEICNNFTKLFDDPTEWEQYASRQPTSSQGLSDAINELLASKMPDDSWENQVEMLRRVRKPRDMTPETFANTLSHHNGLLPMLPGKPDNISGHLADHELKSIFFHGMPLKYQDKFIDAGYHVQSNDLSDVIAYMTKQYQRDTNNRQQVFGTNNNRSNSRNKYNNNSESDSDNSSRSSRHSYRSNHSLSSNRNRNHRNHNYRRDYNNYHNNPTWNRNYSPDRHHSNNNNHTRPDRPTSSNNNGNQATNERHNNNNNDRNGRISTRNHHHHNNRNRHESHFHEDNNNNHRSLSSHRSHRSHHSHRSHRSHDDDDDSYIDNHLIEIDNFVQEDEDDASDAFKDLDSTCDTISNSSISSNLPTPPSIQTLLANGLLERHPHPTKPFTINTSAAETRLGALIQQGDTIIGRFTRPLTIAERHHSKANKERLAVRTVLYEYQALLWHRKFTLTTDQRTIGPVKLNNTILHRFD